MPKLEEMTREADIEQILYFNEKTNMWIEAQVIENYLDFIEIAHANEAPSQERRRASMASNKRSRKAPVTEVIVEVNSETMVLGERDSKVSTLELQNIFSRVMNNRAR